MSKLQLVKLSEICHIESGGTPSSTNPAFWNGDINWATLVDVKNKYIYSTKRKITESGIKNSSAKLLPLGTVLFSSRATIGEVSIAKCELATNQGFKNFICDINKIIPEYLYYVLKYNAKSIEDSCPGTTYKEISKSKIGNYRIPLTSLEEQKRIVTTLDLANDLYQKRKQAIKLLDEYLNSVFLEMFGDQSKNIKDYRKALLSEVSIKITDGEHVTPKRTTSGIKLLSARNVKNGYIDLDAGVDYIPVEEYERIKKRCNPEFGDLLISCSGTIGRITTINITEPFTLVRSVALIKPDKDEIEVKYLEYYLRSSYIQSLILRSVNKSSQANLFLGQINKLPILVPTMEIQKKFVEVVEKKELLKQKMSAQLEHLEIQFQALMQKYFSPN